MDLLKIFQDCWGWCRGNNANQTLPSSPETTDEINNGGAEPESSLEVVTFEETGEEEETKLDLEVINQIKDFDIEDLNPQQESLIDKLIPNKKLKSSLKNMDYVLNVSKSTLEKIGVGLAILGDFKRVSKTEPVAIQK